MDTPRNCVARRTRTQYQQAEIELLEKAKILKEERDRRKTSVSSSSQDVRGEAGGNSLEILEDVPGDQGQELPHSRSAQLQQEQTPVSDASGAGNEEQLLEKRKTLNDKKVKRKGSVRKSSKRRSSDSSIDVEVMCVEYVPLDQRMVLPKSKAANLVQIDGTSLSPSESSSEENNSESDDLDDMGNVLVKSDSDSDDLSYDKDNMEGSTDKHDGSGSSGKVIADENRLECKETDVVDKKRKAVNDHEESGKKKKVLGLDICLDDTKRDDEVSKSLLERLRSRRVSESAKKTLESGKLSCPTKVFESDSSDELDDANDTDHIVQKRSGENNTTVYNKSKRKNCVSKDIDYMDILSDSIWEKSDVLKEKLTPLVEKSPVENALSLKFRFEDEEPAPPEKDEEQIEVDNLFADLVMALTEDDIGGTKVSKEDRNEDAVDVTDPVDSCKLGNHFLVLDEEIGVICKYCGVVQQEIKHVLPDLI